MAVTQSSNILRASLVSAAGTGLARLAGAARDVAIAHVFGAGRESDAFWIAWTVPSIFRRFIADEGLTGALIPAVAQAEKEQGNREARRLANATLTILLVAGGFICLGGVLAAPWLVQAFAHGFSQDPGKLELTIRLTRWLFPFVIFVSLVSYCEGLLNHRGHFFIPKVAPGLVSGCIAVAALLVANRLEQPIFALTIGVLIGGLVHLLACVPPLVALWGLPVPAMGGFGTPRFRAFLGEMGKVVVIGLLAQINVVLLRLLASLLEEGSVTQYWYANRIVDLAQGAIAVGVGSALLPAIARDAAEHCWDDFRRHFAEAVHLVAIFLLPAAGLLLGLAEPIVALLFRHGEFDAVSTGRSAATLQMLVPFMLALAGINIAKKAYFALDDRTTLVVIGAFGLGLTAGLGYLLSTRLGVEGLGLTLSLSTSVQLVIYLVLLRRKMGAALGLPALLLPLVKLAVAAIPAALAAAAICSRGDWALGPASATNWALFAGAGAAAGSIYLVLGWLLKVEELRRLIRRILRRRHPRV